MTTPGVRTDVRRFQYGRGGERADCVESRRRHGSATSDSLAAGVIGPPPAGVQRVFGEAGVDLAELVDVDTDTAAGSQSLLRKAPHAGP
jgi:hypothetical protein